VVRNRRLPRGQGLLQPRQHRDTAQREVGGVHRGVEDAAGLSKGLDGGYRVELVGTQPGRGGLVSRNALGVLSQTVL